MASFLRESKFRHLVVTPAKREFCYDQLKIASHPSEGDGVAANSKFLAYCDAAGSGSALAVLPLSSTGKNHVPISAPSYQQPLIRAHSQLVSDFVFSPFDRHQLYSCSGDGTLKVWQIPAEGFVVDCNSPVATISTSTMIRSLAPHLSASNLVAARSSRAIVLYDVSTGQELQMTESSTFTADVQSMCWSFMGDLLAVTSKDKKLKLIDFRSSSGVSVMADASCHSGVRSSRCAWLGDSPCLASVGHTAAQERELLIWDSRNMVSHVHRTRLDSSTSSPMLFFDPDTNILVVGGKGDSAIKFFETDASVAHPLVNTTGEAGKGMTLMPKQACDLMNCEVLRLLKVVDSSIQPIAVTVPRKERLRFQDDLYPATVWETAASVSSSEWLNGGNIPRNRVALSCGVAGASATLPSSELTLSTEFESNVCVVADSEDNSNSSKAQTPRTKSYGSTLRLRNMFGTENPRSHTFFNIKPNTSNSDSPLIACSDKYWAIPYQGSGGGPVFVSKLNSFGKVDSSCPLVNGHKSAVMDIAFSPFHSGIFATAGSDCVVKVWQLPEDPASVDVLPAMTDGDEVAGLRTHKNSVRTVNFHPTVSGLLASTSQDLTIRLFDVVAGAEVSCTNMNGCEAGALPSNLSFNLDGSLFSVACKDRIVRIYDPRTSAHVLSTPGSEEGGVLGRNLQAVWVGSPTSGKNSILTVSANSTGLRQLYLWDPRSMNEPQCTRSIDNAPGNMIPLFDESSSVCFVAGKGDTIVRYYECSFLNELNEPWGASCERGTDFQSNAREPISGMALMDKRLCDVMNVQVSKLLKLTADSVVPITFTAPRAEGLKMYFQDDVYGPVRSRRPRSSVSDWIANMGSLDLEYLTPLLESLQPANTICMSDRPIEVTTPSSVRKREVIQKEEEDKKLRNATFAKVMSKAGGPKSYKVDAKLVDEDSDENNWDDY